MNIFKIIGILFIIIGIAIGVHQWMAGYPFFQIEDIHHELFMVTFFFSGGILLAIFGRS